MDISTRATDADGLTVRLLGGFQVDVGGRAVADDAWRLRQARSLVKLLALAPDRRLHRERVIDAFWPDLDPATAAHRLEQALHAARRALGPDGGRRSRHLRLEREVLTLGAPGVVRVDVAAFEAAAAAAEAGREAAAYEAALALYAGDLLPEDAYEDWTLGRREALRQAHLGLLVGLAGRREEAGEAAAALDLLRRAVALEPAHEAARRALMRLSAATGRRHEALRQYRQLVEALGRELEAEPEPASRRLYEAILAGQIAALPDAGPPAPPSGARPEPPTNLPASLTSFVGRERELAEARRLLQGTRLLTLTGSGGVGKTRLALAAAAAERAAYPDGVWLVELAAVTEPALVPAAVAGALRVREAPGQPLAARLAAALADKRLLLALDNCEHLAAACAELVERLLRAGPALRALATSREPLGVAGETTWRVPSLSLPEPEPSPDPPDANPSRAAVLRSEAGQLFLERAVAARPDFALTDGNAAAVAEVCRRLDGIPLALELAAARVTALTAEQLAARLDDRFRLLTGGGRTALPRQRTLRATLDWSHDLLAADERVTLRRLAVFAGGWPLEAAEAVCAGDGLDAADVLDLLARLVDKSLVQADEQGEAARYRLLETVRAYAWERLAEAGETEAARDQQRDWCLALTERAAPELRGPRQQWWFDRLAAEHDNLRAALARCLETDPEAGLRLAGDLGQFWQTRGPYAEGRRWLEALLAEAPGRTLPRLRALIAAGTLARSQGDFAAARARLEEGVALARELDSAPLVAETLRNLGDLLIFVGDYRQARARLEEGLELVRAAGGALLGSTLMRLGWLTTLEGDYARAWALLEASLALQRAAGDGYQIGVTLFRLGRVAMARGEDARARELLEESLVVARAVQAPRLMAFIRWSLGDAARWRGDVDGAATHYELGLALAREQEDQLMIAGNLAGLGWVAHRRGEAGRAATLVQESLALATAMGDRPGIGRALHTLGLVAFGEGDPTRAAQRLRESLAVRRELGERPGIVECLEGLAAVAVGTGQAGRAARWLGAAEALREAIGAPLPPVERLEHDAAIATARASLGDDGFAAAWAAGQAVTPEEAVAEALADGDDGADARQAT